MNKAYGLVLMAGMVTLGGCGGTGNDSSRAESEAHAQAAQSPAPPPADEGVFDPLVTSIDRAQAVEGIALDRKAEMDERMKELE